MTILVKVTRAIIWTVVLSLTTTMAGVCLYAAYRVVADTRWEKAIDIGKTLGILFVFIVITLIAGGFVLWAIREHILPLSPEERKNDKPKAAQKQ